MELLSVGTGFLLGLRHSLEADHMAAVSQFASADPRARRGLVVGLLWGAGHGLAALSVALLVLWGGVQLDARFERLAEMGVGVTLIALALWRLWSLFYREHDHEHAHPGGIVHVHAHAHGLRHFHTHGPLLTGLVHGAAGGLGVLLLIPLADSPGGALLVVAAFALGSLLTMGLFGFAAARVYGTVAGPRRTRLYRAAVMVTGVFGLALGAVWLWQ